MNNLVGPTGRKWPSPLCSVRCRLAITIHRKLSPWISVPSSFRAVRLQSGSRLSPSGLNQAYLNCRAQSHLPPRFPGATQKRFPTAARQFANPHKGSHLASLFPPDP